MNVYHAALAAQIRAVECELEALQTAFNELSKGENSIMERHAIRLRVKISNGKLANLQRVYADAVAIEDGPAPDELRPLVVIEYEAGGHWRKLFEGAEWDSATGEHRTLKVEAKGEISFRMRYPRKEKV